MDATVLHKHEKKCTKFRDYIDGLHHEDARMRRIQASQTEKEMAEMETRVDLQVDMIDQLEDEIERHEDNETRHLQEKKAWSMEKTKILRTLDSITGPLYTLVRELDTIYTRASSAHAALRSQCPVTPATLRPRITVRTSSTSAGANAGAGAGGAGAGAGTGAAPNGQRSAVVPPPTRDPPRAPYQSPRPVTLLLPPRQGPATVLSGDSSDN